MLSGVASLQKSLKVHFGLLEATRVSMDVISDFLGHTSQRMSKEALGTMQRCLGRHARPSSRETPQVFEGSSIETEKEGPNQNIHAMSISAPLKCWSEHLTLSNL